MGRWKNEEKYRAQEVALLRELPLDFDWDAAAKRCGITKFQLKTIRDNKEFAKRAEKLMAKSEEGVTDVARAIDKFRKTQQILMDAMEDGDLSVAGAVIKAHEMEYRMHGLFEKDNKQKGSAVQINISLHEEPEIRRVKDVDNGT